MFEELNVSFGDISNCLLGSFVQDFLGAIKMLFWFVHITAKRLGQDTNNRSFSVVNVGIADAALVNV